VTLVTPHGRGGGLESPRWRATTEDRRLVPVNPSVVHRSFHAQDPFEHGGTPGELAFGLVAALLPSAHGAPEAECSRM
jgi:hypothetical protein